MSACSHPDFEAQVIVNRLEDSGLFALELKVWCKACALPFEFPEDIPIGIDLGGIARSVSGQELRVAIHPTTQPDDWSGGCPRCFYAVVDGTCTMCGWSA